MVSLKKFWVGFKDFKGKTARKDFWLGNIGNAIIVFGINYGLTFLIDYGGWYFEVDYYLIDIIIPFLFWIMFIFYYVPALSSCVRRLRDAGFSPWVILIGIIPVMNIVLLILYCFKSKVTVADNPLTKA